MNKSYDHIRSHQVSPNERSWRTVKEKLARRRSQQKAAFYRNLSIAAGLIAILAIVFGFSSQLKLYGDKTYTSIELSSPEFIEDLPLIINDPFYAYDKILEIEEMKNKTPNNRANQIIQRQ